MSNQTSENPLWSRFNHDELIDQADTFKLDELPPIFPAFTIPALQDKPQNPILDTIKLSEKKAKDFTRSATSLPPELHIVAEDLLRPRLEAENQPKGVLWAKLDVHGNNSKVHRHPSVALSITNESCFRANCFHGTHCGQAIERVLLHLSCRKGIV
jgi:hypothetical protein